MVVVISSLSLNCFAYTGFTNTPLRGQVTDYWCWAASDQMLLETQGIILSQTQVAGGIYRAAIPSEARDRLEVCASGIQWDLINGGLSMDQIENTIDSGWAIYLHCESDTSAHVMVVTGYDRNPNGYNNVWLQDPWGDSEAGDLPHPGEEGWCNAAAPATGNYSGSVFEQWQGFKWKATIC